MYVIVIICIYMYIHFPKAPLARANFSTLEFLPATIQSSLYKMKLELPMCLFYNVPRSYNHKIHFEMNCHKRHRYSLNKLGQRWEGEIVFITIIILVITPNYNFCKRFLGMLKYSRKS